MMRGRRVRLTVAVVLVSAAVVFAGCALGSSADRPRPYPAACGDFDLSARRCAAIVEALARDAGIAPDEAARIELLGDPGCGPDLEPPVLCARTMSFVVRVRFTLPDGTAVERSQFCGVGGQWTIMCQEHPLIAVSTPANGYFDVPCTGAVPDTCATRLPPPDPDSQAAARPLEVARLDIPIDRVGEYVVPVGEGSLPNGILTSSSMNLLEPSPGLLFDRSGIRLQITSLEPGGRPFGNYYEHGTRPGVERFSASIRFTIDSLDAPTTITLTDIVVR